MSIALCVALIACGDDDDQSNEVVPRFDPAAADFFGTPWPSDHRAVMATVSVQANAR